MKKGLELKNEGDRAEILLYGSIGDSFWDGSVSAKEFNDMLDEVKNASVINLRLNSPGGEVFDGVAIYNSLLRHSARVEVDIEGIAASIASVIAMAGDEVRIAESAMMMIHDPRTIVVGTAKEMRDMADRADKAKEGLVHAYHRKVDKEGGHGIETLMTDETWFTSHEAVALGLADTVSAGSKLENSFDLSKFGFQHVPEALKAKQEPEKKEPPKEPTSSVEPWEAKHRAREIALAGAEC